MISHFVDIINNDHVSGWCFDDENSGRPVLLKFYAADTKIGETTANKNRPDLKALSFHPSGLCGFDFKIPENICIHNYSSFRIYVDDIDQPVKEFETRTIQNVVRELPQKVFFMHIPKTGGTSFNTFAQTIFPAGSTAIHLESQHASTYLESLDEKMYLAGHLPLREIQANFDLVNIDMFTILREPYAHLHSHLNWVKNIGSDPNGEFFLNHSVETRQLALLLNELDFSVQENLDLLVDGICGELTSLFDNHQTRYLLDYRRVRVVEEDLDIATAQLDKFKLIGCTDQLQNFIESFCSLYNITPPASVDKLNTSQISRIFDTSNSDIRTALFPFVRFDLQLYERLL